MNRRASNRRESQEPSIGTHERPPPDGLFSWQEFERWDLEPPEGRIPYWMLLEHRHRPGWSPAIRDLSIGDDEVALDSLIPLADAFRPNDPELP